MEVILPRAWLCPLFLVILLFSPIASAVDPIDFLESLKDDEEPHSRDSSSTEYPNGVNVIPGEADVNYPTYAKVPKSSFSCIGRPPGFYADTELRCQVWHICDEDRRQQSFLCTNGTVYSQDKRVCDWWYNVNCDPSEVSRNYIQNLDLYKGPPSKSDNDQTQNNGNDDNRNNRNDENRNNRNDENRNNRNDENRNNRNDENRNNRNDENRNNRNDENRNNRNDENRNNRNDENRNNRNDENRNNRNDENRSNNNKNFNNNNNDFDYQPTTKSYNNDPFSSQFPSARQSQQKPRFNQNNEQRNPEPTQSYNEPSSSRGDTTYSNSNNNNNNNNNGFSSSRRQPTQQSQAPQRPTTTSTTTYRPPTTYNTPPPPAALQSSSFPPRAPQHQQRPHSQQQSQQKPQQQSTPAPSRSVPSIKTTNANGKRIVEIRVPVSQIPPEILAKYGKRIPEHLLKEIFLNFTRNQQQELQKEAISNAKPNNPTGAGPNARAPPPSAPIQQNRQSNNSPPPPPQSSKKPVNFNGNNNNNKPSSFNGNSNSKSAPPPPPPPPPPSEPQQKFRHSTPRKVDNVKFATPTRELLDQYDDERQQVGESQNPIYSLQQLFSTQHSRTSAKSKAPSANEVPRVKESFNYDATLTAATQEPPQQYQEFTRPQPRRRIHTTTTTAATTTTRATTEEPQLYTDRYFPVATKEEKKQADIRRIFLVAKQGIKVLPPIPVLSAAAAVEVPTARRQPPSLPVTHRPQFRTTPVHEFSKIPPPPKVAIPNDYYVQNERFEEAESRYPRPSAPPSFSEPQFQQRQYSRPTTTSIPPTTTTTTTPPPPPPPTPRFEEQEFRRTKPNKSNQNNKKKATPPPQEKSQDDDNDYDSNQERVNQDELELLRLAQQYIELTGQDFGVRKTPRNA